MSYDDLSNRGLGCLGVPPGGSPVLDPDLQALLASWSVLPGHVRLTIKTLLDATARSQDLDR